MRTQGDPYALALAALGATLSEPRRARRFLDLTGIEVDDLREQADSPAVLIALLSFLEGHEPDLLDVAQEIGVEPGTLVSARGSLSE